MSRISPHVVPKAANDTAPATTEFRAPIRHGELRLALRATAPAPSRPGASLQAALLLAEAEPLLRWLEDWLDEPLQPAPLALAAAMSAAAPASACVRLRWETDVVAAVVELPWSLLLAGRAPPRDDRAGGVEIGWEALPLTLELAREALPDAEWAELRQPGAGLLLRASFAGDGMWHCTLRPSGDRAARDPAWPATWACSRGRLQWGPGHPAEPPLDAPGTIVVRLAQALWVTPPQLMGWSGEAACDCDGDQPLALERAPEGREALRGRLVPLGLRLPGGAASASTGALAHAGWLALVEPPHDP